MAKKRANGEGNIRKRADGRWEGRYTAGYYPETGKRIIKNVLGKTQAECKAKLKNAIEESQTLDVGRADEYAVAAWLRTWFELYAKPHIRPSTMNYYHRNIEQHIIPAIGDIPLNKLTTRDLQKLYNDLQNNGRLRKVQKKEKPGLSNSTVRGIHMMLHNALDRAVKENLILSRPKTGNSIREVSIPQDAGLPHIRFHDLRHAFATMALQNGVDVKTVSSMLGHYDAGFTLRTYTHVTRQMQQKAAQTMGSFMAQIR